jgi:hypothetical protein
MKHPIRTGSLAPLCAVLALALASGVAQAAPKASKHVDQARLNYERERAACMTGRTQQPRDVCLKEAGAAYAEARRSRLTSPGGDDASLYAANAARRCEVQKGDMRDLCLRRVAGEGTVSGSVAAGGKMEELSVVTTNPPATGPAKQPPR